MSKFSNQGHDVTLGIRERYLWELLSPAPTIRSTSNCPQFRAELHDRFMSPIYPFAFAALTFAFLGAPRTTRQSATFRSAVRFSPCSGCGWPDSPAP